MKTERFFQHFGYAKQFKLYDVEESKIVAEQIVSLVLIRAVEMQVVSEKGDTITTPSGTVYRVVDQFLGMGEILYNLHLRAM